MSRIPRLRSRAFRVSAVALGLWIILWLLAGYHSPLAPWVTRLAFASAQALASVEQPGTTLAADRAGLGLGLQSIRITGLRASAPDVRRLEIDYCLVRFRWLPLLTGRLSTRAVAVDGLRADVTARPPVPGVPMIDSNRVELMRRRLDLAHPPFLFVTNADITVTLVSTDAPPLHATLSGLSFRSQNIPRRERKDGLSYAYDLAAGLRIEAASATVIRATGRLDPRGHTVDDLSLDASVTVPHLPLPAFNPMLEAKAPFSVENGSLDVQFDVCVRDSRLSGLCTLATRDLAIHQNAENRGATFLTLSLNTWEFLVRQRSGRILVDCPVEGTLLRPEVRVGAVLQNMVGNAGRNLTTRFFETIGARGIADDIENHAARKAKHDDILKIQRLPPQEQHFERGQHFETVVRNYATALEEYAAQLREYPGETNLAVQALMASGEVRFRHLKDTRGALSDLRRVLTEYGRHPTADDALLRMVDMAVETKDYPQADSLCQEFLDRFSQSAFRERVRQTRRDISRFVW